MQQCDKIATLMINLSATHYYLNTQKVLKCLKWEKFFATALSGPCTLIREIIPRKELMEQFESSRADKMYVDRKDGKTYHTGYIIRDRWVTVVAIEGATFATVA